MVCSFLNFTSVLMANFSMPDQFSFSYKTQRTIRIIFYTSIWMLQCLVPFNFSFSEAFSTCLTLKLPVRRVRIAWFYEMNFFLVIDQRQLILQMIITTFLIALEIVLYATMSTIFRLIKKFFAQNTLDLCIFGVTVNSLARNYSASFVTSI